MLLESAIERLYDLNVGTTPLEEGTPHERIPCSGASTTAASHPAAERLKDRLRNRQNDHPTNGLALCKNHHWAMDRNLIAPAPDHQWLVSKVLDPRRSNGEKELIALSGKSLRLSQDQAFYPDS